LTVLDIIIDFSSEPERKLLYNELRKARGKNRITISKYRKRRSDNQNRFYWSCFVHPFGEFLREQGENLTDDDAHEMLKMKFLRVVIHDDKAGDLECARSTTKLDVAEYNDYLDRCSHFLNEMFGIVTPEPAIYHCQ